MKLTITLEKGDNNDLWGVCSTKYFTLSTVAESRTGVANNIRDLIQDFIEHEGKEIEEWKNVDAGNLQFKYNYSLLAFFEAFDVIKITKLAELAGLNPGLVRQYAVDTRQPSLKQVKKIEDAIHKLGEELLKVRLK
jgi:hypothetical protein